MKYFNKVRYNDSTRLLTSILPARTVSETLVKRLYAESRCDSAERDSPICDLAAIDPNTI